MSEKLRVLIADDARGPLKEMTCRSAGNVNAELKLIKTAILNVEYEYLHLISGVDLPLKKQR